MNEQKITNSKPLATMVALTTLVIGCALCTPIIGAFLMQMFLFLLSRTALSADPVYENEIIRLRKTVKWSYLSVAPYLICAIVLSVLAHLAHGQSPLSLIDIKNLLESTGSFTTAYHSMTKLQCAQVIATLLFAVSFIYYVIAILTATLYTLNSAVNLLWQKVLKKEKFDLDEMPANDEENIKENTVEAEFPLKEKE